MGGARRTLDANPEETNGHPGDTNCNSQQSNGNKPSERLWGNKENSGTIKSAMEGKPKKTMVTQRIGNKPKERQWKNKENNGRSKENYGAYPEETNGLPGHDKSALTLSIFAEI